MRRPFTTLAAALLAFIAVVHVLRIVLGWKVIIGEQVMALGGTMIPMWVSYLGIAIFGGLAAMLWKEAK